MLALSIASLAGLAALALTGAPAAHATTTTSAAGVVTAPVGQDPEAAAVSPDGSRVFVANDSSGTVSVVSPTAKKVTSTIHGTSHYAAAIAFSKDGRYAYVGNGAEDSVSIVQVSADRVVDTVSVDFAANVLRVSTDGTLLDIGDGYGDTAVMTTATNKVVATPPSSVYLNDDFFSPDGKYSFSLSSDTSNDVSLDRVQLSTGDIVASVGVGTFDEAGDDLAVSAGGTEAAVVQRSATVYGSGDIAAVNLTSMKVGADWPFSVTWVDTVGVSPDGKSIVVGLDGGTTSQNIARVISASTGSASAGIPLDAGPLGVAFSANGTIADVLTRGQYTDSGAVERIPLATPTASTLIGVGKGPVAVAEAPSGSAISVPNSTDGTVTIAASTPTGWRPSITRLSGADRYETSIAIADAEYPAPSSVATLYIASGLEYPDALSVSNVAAWGGALLLTPPNGLTTDLEAEVQRLQPGTIDIIGDTSSVSPTVETQLNTLFPGIVHRIAGADRYATNVAVQSLRYGRGDSTMWIVNGGNYPDALSASSAAKSEDAPMVMVDGSAATLSGPTLDFIDELSDTSSFGGTPHYIVVGDTHSVSAGIAAQLGAMGTVTRLSGADRYATSQAVNTYAYPQAQRAFFAVGTNYPDSLTGSTEAGGTGSPLYLVQPTCVPTPVIQRLSASGAGSVTLFGSTASLSASVAALKHC